MTGKLFNSPDQTEERSQTRTIAEILALPPNQRKIVNYIRRNKQSTIDDLLEVIEETQETIEAELNLLIQEGFLNVERINDNLYYSFEFGQKQGVHTELNHNDVHTNIVPGKPIALIINPSSNYAITAGEEFILRVSVINQGGQSALIYLKFDESCELVQKVCGYIEPQSVALNSGQSHELVFKILIPRETLTGSYKYRLEIDAPSHYPEDTPIFHQAQLQVRPYIAEIEKESDPFFVVSPQTTSTNPFVTQVSQPITVTIQVYNRSDQVDRFRLTCTDLPPEWYKITYPEGAPLPGLVVNTDGLELNPGEANTIILTITPPQDAIAKIYAPTLRVYSENLLPKTEAEAQLQQSSELVMLDLFYFKVQAYYQLNAEMNTRRGTIKEATDQGEYEIRLANKGNTARQLKLVIDPQNSEKYCVYKLSLDELILNPSDSTRIRLDVSPQGTWKRQFYPNVLNFNVEIIDQEEIEIPNDQFDGILVIEGRPWWQFFFLILGILGTIGALIFLVWYLFFRAKPLPQVTSFNSQSVIYREVNNDVIRLNWEITQAQRIKSITINGYYKDGSPIAKPMTFDFTRGLPEELKDKCTLQQILSCNGIVTNARKSEEYTFELTLVTKGKRSQIISAKTNPIKIEAIPIPEISEFASTQPQYSETKPLKTPPAKTENKVLDGQILLNWTVKFVDQLQELTLVGKDKEGAVVYPLQSIFVVKVDDPKKVPQQLQLLPIKNNSILILQLINPDTNQEEINTCVVQDGKQRTCIPIPNFCQIKNEFQTENLICRGFPTGIRKPGEYTFELTPIPKKPLEKPLPPKISDVIKILALPVNILSFQVKVVQNGELIGLKNGQVLPELAKYPIPIVNPNKPLVLEISWIVDGGSDLTVQLTPSPGNVKPEGKMNYFVSTNPGSETITLTASNLSGNQVSRSFVIESVLPPETAQGQNGQNPQNGGQKTPPPPGTNQPGTPPPDRVPTLGEPPAVTPPPETPANGGNNNNNNNNNQATPAPTPSTPPRPPEAPGSTAPLPPGRNSPPPAELPPKIQ